MAGPREVAAPRVAIRLVLPGATALELDTDDQRSWSRKITNSEEAGLGR